MSSILGIIFWILSVFPAILLLKHFFLLPGSTNLFFGGVLGMLVTAWMGYAFSLIAHSLGSQAPMSIAMFMMWGTLALINGWVLFRWRDRIKSTFSDGRFEWILCAGFVAFSSLLMWHTFHYKADGTAFMMDGFVWSDFASHIPLIRSFSLGENIPTRAPLFAEAPIRYHFLFYFYVAILERSGLPIDWALNIPSLFGFAACLSAIVHFTRLLLQNLQARLAPLLAVFLFLTSSSLAFFFQFKFPGTWSLHSLYGVTIGRIGFLSGGPYYNWDEIITGLFWTLTVFTNQRHFAFGIAVGLLVFAALLTISPHVRLNERRSQGMVVGLGVAMGLLPFLHGLSFLAFMMVLAIYMPFSRNWKTIFLFLATASIVALPQMLFFSPQESSAGPAYHLGYAVNYNFTWVRLLWFWFANLGIKAVALLVLPFLLRGLPRRIFLASLILFVVPNLIRFGVDVYVNHKFFNIWLIFINSAVAIALVPLWSKKRWGKPLFCFLLLGCSLSGLLDLPPLFNNEHHEVRDEIHDPIAKFFAQKTDPKENVATSYGIYHPVSTAGRSILLGWPYFLLGAGFDIETRQKLVAEIFETKNMKRRCSLMKQFSARFIVTGHGETYSEPYHPDVAYLKSQFPTVISDERVLVFDTKSICTSLRAKDRM